MRKKIASWWNEQQKTFNQSIEDSEFCRVLGITPWHFTLQGLAVMTAIFLAILLFCGIAELLEGGMA